MATPRLPITICKSRIEPRAGHISVSYGDKLVLIWSGYKHKISDDNSEWYIDTRDVFVYLTEAQKWLCFKSEGDVPKRVSGAAGVLVDDFLYVFGGHYHSTLLVDSFRRSFTLYCLDLRTMIWTTLKTNSSACPTPRHKLCGWYHKNALYFFGGFGVPPSLLSQLTEFAHLDFLTDSDGVSSFVADPSIPNALQSAWNNQLIRFDLEKNVWSAMPTEGDRPCARAAHAGALLSDGKRAVIFGGRHKDVRLDDLYLLDLEQLRWTKLSPHIDPISLNLPCGRSWSAMCTISATQMLLFGGFTTECQPLGDCWILEEKQSELVVHDFHWRQLSWLPRDLKRLWHSAAGVGGAAYIFGGCRDNIFDESETEKFTNDLFSIDTKPQSLVCLSTRAVARLSLPTQLLSTFLPTSLLRQVKLHANTDDAVRSCDVKSITQLLHTV